MSTALSPLTVAEFNNLPTAQARELLGAVLDIAAYIDSMESQRPFGSLAGLQSASAAAADQITWPEVATALARHPRIGEKTVAKASGSVDQAWSAAEQSGVRAEEVDEFAVGNAAYEAKFGFIFLICASGLSGEQMLAALRERLTHTMAEEQPIVISQLQQIAALRMARAVVLTDQ